MRNFTGIDDAYEPPVEADVHCKTEEETARDSADKVLAAVERRVASTS